MSGLKTKSKTPPSAIRWHDDQLFLLDQTQLPDKVSYEHQSTREILWEAIKQLKVRGAPAIGIAAAYGMVVAMQSHTDKELPPEDFRRALQEAGDYLKSARPTAVNLAWAVDQIQATAEQEPTLAAITRKAQQIHADDIAMCTAIGEHGLPIVTPGSRLLTHCNAGALAVSALGTATAPMYLAKQKGIDFQVYADETRPLLQGARLTAWELAQADIPVTLICDNMTATMQRGGIDAVIVGTDRVAKNGDVVNKIGTLGVAIMANHYGVPFYVACPASTYDPTTPSGAEVIIEQRDPIEVRAPWELPGVSIENPAFDVTPVDLVTGYITNVGLLKPSELDRLLEANTELSA